MKVTKEDLIKALRCVGHNVLFHYCDNTSCCYCVYSCSENLHRCDTQALGTDAAGVIEEADKKIEELEMELLKQRRIKV